MLPIVNLVYIEILTIPGKYELALKGFVIVRCVFRSFLCMDGFLLDMSLSKCR
jgi:hypothetical protein